jgi:hypothetical protein
MTMRTLIQQLWSGRMGPSPRSHSLCLIPFTQATTTETMESWKAIINSGCGLAGQIWSRDYVKNR